MQGDREHDIELMQAIRRRDEKAFEELCKRYAGALKAVAVRIVGDPGRAEEIVQDVLFKNCWLQANKFEPREVGTLLGWLRVCIHHAAVQEIRGHFGTVRYRESETLEAGSLHETGETDEGFAAVERAFDTALKSPSLYACIDTLPVAQRQAIMLAHSGTSTLEEIAHRINVALPTLKWRIQEGLRKLRRCADQKGLKQE